MKKTLFFLIFLFPCFSFAQKKSIDGFMDIPFGSDSATVKAAVLAKGGRQINSLDTKNELVFSNLSLNQRPVFSLAVTFVKNKAYLAIFSFEYNDDTILQAYDDLTRDITAVYGEPYETDNHPEFKSLAAKIRKIKSKDIVAKTLWQSKNKNGMGVVIDPAGQSFMLELVYQENSLAEIAADKRRSDL